MKTAGDRVRQLLAALAGENAAQACRPAERKKLTYDPSLPMPLEDIYKKMSGRRNTYFVDFKVGRFHTRSFDTAILSPKQTATSDPDPRGDSHSGRCSRAENDPEQPRCCRNETGRGERPALRGCAAAAADPPEAGAAGSRSSIHHLPIVHAPTLRSTPPPIGSFAPNPWRAPIDGSEKWPWQEVRGRPPPAPRRRCQTRRCPAPCCPLRSRRRARSRVSPSVRTGPLERNPRACHRRHGGLERVPW